MSPAFLTTLVVLVLPPPDHDLRVTPKLGPTQVEVSVLLPKELADKLPAPKVPQEEGEKLLQLRLVSDGKNGPVMLGSYQRDGQKLTFVPRFPLQHEKTYRACFLQAGLETDAVIYKVPARPPTPRAEVVAVWPTGDVLPANHLRFYIQFSRPMRGGPDIFDQIYLLDRDGKKVDDPWLRDELWSEDGTTLTLYIHPGRIKWGVLLRLLLGPVLEPDRTYTFVVGADMLDADERKLAKEFRKQFRTSAEDRVRIELSAWKLQAPQVGGREALVVAFPKTLDHRGAEQFLKMVDAKGKAVAGKVEVGKDGRSWKFVPEAAWTNQEYKVAVDDRLEDVAGNTPGHAFDVDADAPALPPQRMWLTFKPRK